MPDALLLKFDPAIAPERAFALAQDALRTHLELEKAVAPHPSRVQPRAAGGQFARPHHAASQPRDEAGRFRQRLTRVECRDSVDEARRVLAEELDPRLQDHLADVTAERIDLPEWHKRCLRDLRTFYEDLYLLGKRAVGDPAPVATPQDRHILNELLKDEADFLSGFAQAIGAGEGHVPYAERMAMYTNAAREAFWHGYALGDQRSTRQIAWRAGDTEHCASCAKLDALGWLPAKEFVARVLARGLAPQSGQLDCRGIHCQCRLVERLAGVEQEGVGI